MAFLTMTILNSLAFLLGVATSILVFVIQNVDFFFWMSVCCVGVYMLFKYVLSFKVTIHPATKAVFQDMVLMFQKESMFPGDSSYTAAAGEGEDADLTQEPVRKDIKLVRPHRRIPYAVRVAHLAKAQVGLLSNIKANELVYARICREEMIKHGLRPSHIAHMVPLAVAACFIPLDEDFLAASLRQCAEMRDRRALLGPSDYK